MLATDIIKREFGCLVKKENIKENENGKSARTFIPCPICDNPKAIITCCSDVGGIWIRCDKCGHFEDI